MNEFENYTGITPRERLARICQSLPEVTTEGDQHLIFRVRGRTFAYYLDDHHGDGEVALSCKAEPGLNTLIAKQDPRRFYIPSYVGPRGWIAARLNLPDVDWDEIADLVFDSYCLVAPKRLVAEVQEIWMGDPPESPML
jgi:hypothetical protein